MIDGGGGLSWWWGRVIDGGGGLMWVRGVGKFGFTSHTKHIAKAIIIDLLHS